MKKNIRNANAIRVFETVARHLSFSRAACELNVTQSAISHQIKNLEIDLNTNLFYKKGSKICLSEDGSLLFFSVSKGLSEIDGTINRIKNKSFIPDKNIKISVTPSFSHYWLIPRISNFKKIDPNINLNIQQTTSLDKLRKSEVHISIYPSQTRVLGFFCDELMPVSLEPIFGMEYKNSTSIYTPENLLGETLIHYKNTNEWNKWFKLNNIKFLFEDYNNIILDDNYSIDSLTFDNQGISLGRIKLIADDLKRRRLKRVFPNIETLSMKYYFVCVESHLESKSISSFYKFIKNEIECSELPL